MSLNLDPRLRKLLLTYEEVFGALPPPLSCKELVQMDLNLKPGFEETRVRHRPYPAPQEQVEEIERQIRECIDSGLVEEYEKGDYPHQFSPCFLVAKPGSTALYKTKMNKRSGLWQVELTPAAQELLAFITPKGRVFNSKVIPLGWLMPRHSSKN